MVKNNTRRKRNKDIIAKIKIDGECLLCLSKENLTFHHREPKNKRDTISNLAMKPSSVNKLYCEIAKCDLLCQDCHSFIHLANSGNLKKYKRFIQYLKNQKKL